MQENLVIVAYETPFAPCGGLAAVMAHLPQALRRRLGAPPAVITPYHHRIEKTAALPLTNCGSLIVKFSPKARPRQDGSVRVEINKHEHDGCPFYFLRAEHDQFFSGFPHPYVVPNLLQDSLFFGAAAVRALEYLFPQSRCTVLLQDWEAATVALVLANVAHKHRLYLTLHNSYDAAPVWAEDLETVGIDPASCPGPAGGSGVVERAIRVVRQPVITVSQQFALDLSHDILQTRVMAPQLQQIESFKPVGINNGPFTNLQFDRSCLLQSAAGFQDFRQHKIRQRQEFLDALAQHEPCEQQPVWGNLDLFGREELPWFVMAGRDDQQKGYDIAAHAAETFLQMGGRANFLFFPMPRDQGTARLGFLRQIAEQHPRSVLVLPFRFEAAFTAALQGATYGLVPSFYEPFGMANELYLNGVVTIGRATGGTIQQIVPLQAAACFSPAVRRLSERWHSFSSHPTGLLYRERDDLPSTSEDWKFMTKVHSQYRNDWNVNWAQGLATFRSMQQELLLAIQDGVRVYTQTPELYHAMLSEGVSYIERTFSWQKAAAEYARVCMES